VDYIEATKHELSSHPIKYRQFLQKHHDAILNARNKFPELCSPAAKLGWVTTYHNRTLNSLRADFLQKYGIEKEKLLL